jgi:hypothetical protein
MGKPKKSKPRKKSTVSIEIDEELMNPIHDAQKVLVIFLDAWKSQDYNKIVDSCNKTWLADGHQMMTALGWITLNLGIHKLNNYDIKGGWREGEAMYCFNIHAIIDGRKCTLNINVLCETAPYCPDIENGAWGVNPVSASQIRWVS